MAVATKRENKSGFVQDFLSEHPEGNVKAVNEAWTAAGMTGEQLVPLSSIRREPTWD